MAWSRRIGVRSHALIRGRAATAILLALPAQAAALNVAQAKTAITAELRRDQPSLVALYESIHRQPELSFQETRTAERLAAEMRRLGFQVTEHIGKTGVVALYRNGPGPTVMVRTELDALPMEEKTGLPYASHARQISGGREEFVAHSCGHDLHMAIWVGTARALLATKNRWRGTLMFIAQPSEELGGGAKAMLDDGLFARIGKPGCGGDKAGHRNAGAVLSVAE